MRSFRCSSDPVGGGSLGRPEEIWHLLPGHPRDPRGSSGVQIAQHASQPTTAHRGPTSCRRRPHCDGSSDAGTAAGTPPRRPATTQHAHKHASLGRSKVCATPEQSAGRHESNEYECRAPQIGALNINGRLSTSVGSAQPVDRLGYAFMSHALGIIFVGAFWNMLITGRQDL